MSQFMFQVSYNNGSWATRVQQQANVLERMQPLMDALDGTVTSCFYAFGEYDIVLIADFPGHEEALAFDFAVKAGGSVSATQMTPLVSVEEGISAMTRAAEAGHTRRRSVAVAAPIAKA
jgi:uncharacterized protein with GYD domain